MNAQGFSILRCGRWRRHAVGVGDSRGAEEAGEQWTLGMGVGGVGGEWVGRRARGVVRVRALAFVLCGCAPVFVCLCLSVCAGAFVLVCLVRRVCAGMRVLVCLCSCVRVCAFALVRLCPVCVCDWHVTCVEDHTAFGEMGAKASRGFEPRSLDSESRLLTVTPRGLCRSQRQRNITVAKINKRRRRDSNLVTQNRTRDHLIAA